MGYHVTILRTVAGESQPIGRDEVKAVLASRTDLRLQDHEGLPWIRLGGEKPGQALVLQNGEIWTKNPERETMLVMLELARVLGARVRGDELETYRTPDEWYTHPDDERRIAQAKREAQATRRRTQLASFAWLAGVLLVMGVIGLAVEFCTSRWG
jgi:hypothetical protein